jgi:DNA replication protein DnaD
LISANHKDGTFKGQKVKRGQVITGRIKISSVTGISEQSVRTCLQRLESTNEITIETTNKNSIITLLNYDLYQSDEGNDSTTNQQPTSKITNNQPTTNQQLTTNKNDNNKKNKEEVNEVTHNDVLRKLWYNRTWLESLAMLWKKEIKEIQEHLNKFRLECISKEDLKSTEKDAKEHFVNWTKYNPIPEPQGYVYKRPDLSSLERNPF